MVNKKLLLIIGIAVITLTGIILLVEISDVWVLSSDEFSELIQNENVFVINAHTPYYGEIEGTDLIAENWENMKYYAEQLPKDKNTSIAIYCRSGAMSEVASKQLAEMGYKNIYDLKGGMNSWQQGGRKIINEE
ncbi:MAG: rhodanese-like domain-containing protein [Candidatus Pacearchaeota archaeon]